MPNQITADGIETATQQELVAQYNTDFQNIFGVDINLDPDTPDGQMINIFIQSVLDLEDLLTQIYNSFDPDNAIGNVLDQRVSINGIQRQAGTFTITNITLVTSQSVNLYGLDQAIQDVYTVADNAGTQWELMVTQLGLSSGTNVLAFRAKNPGETQTVPNTITVPVTIVLGVVSINNPTTYTVLGINEESDAALKIRRQQSVSLASQGYLAGLIAALRNLTGMSSVFVYENNTDLADGDGVPGHSIWVITSGTATDADIAQAIYDKRNAGCGMFGDQTYQITQVDGSLFTIKWDVVEPEDIFIKFTTTSLDGVNPPNIAAIRSGLVTQFVPGVFAEVNINGLATVVQDIDPNTLVTLAGFSTTSGGSYTNTLTPTAKNFQFAVSEPNIIILPMILSPYNPVTASPLIVQTGEDLQFVGLGGFGALVYSLVVNNSGASIDSGTGLYTAGATPNVTDQLRVTDSLSNTADAFVTVV